MLDLTQHSDGFSSGRRAGEEQQIGLGTADHFEQRCVGRPPARHTPSSMCRPTRRWDANRVPAKRTPAVSIPQVSWGERSNFEAAIPIRIAAQWRGRGEGSFGFGARARRFSCAS
jgi:hypothetical protein